MTALIAFLAFAQTASAQQEARTLPTFVLSELDPIYPGGRWARRPESDPFAARKVIHLRA